MKKNGKHKPIRHPDRLVDSDADMINLCAVVVNNYNRLLGTYKRLSGTDLMIPSDMLSVQKLVTKLMQRYERGDFRNSDSEKSALRNFAQWTVDVNAELRGQEVVTQIQWKD